VPPFPRQNAKGSQLSLLYYENKWRWSQSIYNYSHDHPLLSGKNTGNFAVFIAGHMTKPSKKQRIHALVGNAAF